MLFPEEQEHGDAADVITSPAAMFRATYVSVSALPRSFGRWYRIRLRTMRCQSVKLHGALLYADI